jgi:hypothetical protein
VNYGLLSRKHDLFLNPEIPSILVLSSVEEKALMVEDPAGALSGMVTFFVIS